MRLSEKHMDLITRTRLENLLEGCGEPCVSIFIPTHRKRNKVQDAPARLENLSREAERQLLEAGMSTLSALEFLNPLNALVDNAGFWRRQTDGLAVFLTPESFCYYRLPIDFKPLVVTGKNYYIRPLLPVIANDGRFYVLSLNLGGIQLIHGTHYTLNEIDLRDIPEALAESLRYYEFEESLRAYAPSPAGGRGASAEMQPVRENISRYLRQINNGVCRFLEDGSTPLVLAGVDYIRAFYREVNDYGNLAGSDIEGHPEDFTIEELHRQAWNIVEPLFRNARLSAVEAYRDLAARKDRRASDSLEQVLNAAYEGRVDTLFVPMDRQCFGIFDPEENTISVHSRKEPGDEDLLNAAVIHTIQNGGDVYALEPGEMPSDAPAAATLRD